VVNYPSPTASDNWPGVVALCTPPSASSFPLGVTTVSCTATDQSGNAASCRFTVTVFNGCLQDDGQATTVLLINTQTGDYRFCCQGLVVSGKGTIVKHGNTWTLSHTAADRRVRATLDGSGNRGTGSLQMPPGTTQCLLTDRKLSNNACNCW
jgi:hypothetical protein